MRRTDRDRDRRLANRHTPQAMRDTHPDKPVRLPRAPRDPRQRAQRQRRVRLVAQARDGPALEGVPRRAEEEHVGPRGRGADAGQDRVGV